MVLWFDQYRHDVQIVNHHGRHELYLDNTPGTNTAMTTNPMASFITVVPNSPSFVDQCRVAKIRPSVPRGNPWHRGLIIKSSAKTAISTIITTRSYTC